MPAFFSSDGSFLLQFLAIFSIIVVVMGAVYLLYRRFSGRGLSLAARAGNRSRQPRLGIVDIYELDRQRQLILLRRDNVEHLLLVGGPNDVVVERNVQRGAASRLPAEMRAEAEPAAGPSAANFAMPIVVPEAATGAPSAPEVKPPRLDPALFEPDSGVAALPEPAPAQEAAGARARAGRFLRRTPPPLVNPRPETASERPRSDPPPAEPEPASPPIVPATEPQAIDPAILSDMARQLEVALRRPSSAVTPPPFRAAAQETAPTPPPPEPEPAQPVPEPPPAPPAPEARSPDPIAAGMAASQVLSPLAPAPEPVPPPLPAPPPPAPEPPQPAPEPPPEAPAPKPAPPPPPPAAVEPPQPVLSRPQEGKAEPQPTAAPFSVEEIEAEFARLLGRPLDKKG